MMTNFNKLYETIMEKKAKKMLSLDDEMKFTAPDNEKDVIKTFKKSYDKAMDLSQTQSNNASDNASIWLSFVNDYFKKYKVNSIEDYIKKAGLPNAQVLIKGATKYGV